jgi:hypothetical protein
MKKFFVVVALIFAFFAVSCDGVSDNGNEKSIIATMSQSQPQPPCSPPIFMIVHATKNPCNTDKLIIRILYSNPDGILYIGQTSSGMWVFMFPDAEYEYGCPLGCSPCKIKISNDDKLFQKCFSLGKWQDWKEVSW